jgi:ribosomal protein S18 acetylase RimI-like enzyme
MQKQPAIREATRDDLDTLVGIFCDSFARDPQLNWMIPLPRLYPDFFRLVIEGVYLPRGRIHMDTEGRAAALWLPPGERPELPGRLERARMLAELTLSKGPAPLLRIHRQGALFARRHPREPHFYLQFIGVRHRCQGQGLGSALLREGTRLCDAQESPAYLESSNSRSVPLYERHGFSVIHQQPLAKNGPTVWFMWREPAERARRAGNRRK